MLFPRVHEKIQPLPSTLWTNAATPRTRALKLQEV